MIPFWIDQSEAFLIGIALGHARCEEVGYFGTSLRRVLEPFLPNMNSDRHWQVSNLPDDVEHVADGVYRTPSRDIYYFPTEHDDWRAASRDNSRSSLYDLVQEYVLDCVTLDEMKSMTDHESRTCFTVGIAALNLKFDHELQRLAHESYCDSEYKDGQVFGEYLALIDQLQASFSFWDNLCVSAPKPDDFFKQKWLPKISEDYSRVADVAHEMLETQVLHHCSFARTALSNLIEHWDAEHRRGYWHPTSGEKVQVDGLPTHIVEYKNFIVYHDRLSQAAQTFWLSVGMIWRYLQDIPAVAGGRSLPRQFLSTRVTSVPGLRAAIDIAERELHDPNPQYAPADVAFHLITGIEPLVRSVWPDGDDLGELLFDKIRDEHGESQKCASIAFSLHKQYRNLAIHEGHRLEKTVNSWAEAMYIYSAVKLLLELHDRITKK
jgi:hypothetical protein